MKNTGCYVPLRERYPTAAKWKRQGLQHFPELPLILKLDVIASLGLDEEGLRQSARKHLQSPIFCLCTQEELKEMEDYCAKEGSRLMAIYRLMRSINKKKKYMQDKALEAINKVDAEGERRQAAKNLGNAILPRTKGGRGTYFQSQEIVIRFLHSELHQCIKLMKSRMDISGKRTSEPSHNAVTLEDVKANLPDISDILTDAEILTVTNQNLRASDAAFEIISRRLKKHKNLRHRLTPRSLKNIVHRKICT